MPKSSRRVTTCSISCTKTGRYKRKSSTRCGKSPPRNMKHSRPTSSKRLPSLRPVKWSQKNSVSCSVSCKACNYVNTTNSAWTCWKQLRKLSPHQSPRRGSRRQTSLRSTSPALAVAKGKDQWMLVTAVTGNKRESWGEVAISLRTRTSESRLVTISIWVVKDHRLSDQTMHNQDHPDLMAGREADLSLQNEQERLVTSRKATW